MEQENNPIDKLYNNQQIIVKQVNDQLSAIQEMNNEIEEQKEYLSSVVESYKTMIDSVSQLSKAVINLDEGSKALGADFAKLQQKVATLANIDTKDNKISDAEQTIIKKQDEIISLYTQANTSLINQITEKQRILEQQGEENLRLMNNLAAKHKEMADIAAKWESEQQSLNSKIQNLYIIVGILALAIIGLGIKTFLS